ncbi:MAG: CBS domain-containing protein [Blastocatellia bacterium]
MKVTDVMTTDVRVCRPETNLAVAAALMWETDCGALPVVDEAGKVIGMLTDRDIAIAVGTRGRNAAEIAAREVISGQAYTTMPDVEIKTAIRAMNAAKVRRLPVVNADGQLQGILSLHDLVLHAGEAKDKRAAELSNDDVMHLLKAFTSQVPAKQAATVYAVT